ncbi:hypothetical protein HYU15_00535 [Candidatus Woesearchaeota archaeon]|nr:hypothetical protein [Candidatus Woesearchaeota archaeon]
MSERAEKEVEGWMEKVRSVGKGGADLSKDEDLSIALMNLISLEEHSYFTAMKTDNAKYLGMMNSIRELRKTLLKRIVKDPKGEEWCISKHLLAASMRLIEVGTKEQSQGNKKDATFMFSSAFHLYSLFFAINLKLVGAEGIKSDALRADAAKPGHSGGMGRFSEIIKKIVDCCKE